MNRMPLSKVPLCIALFTLTMVLGLMVPRTSYANSLESILTALPGQIGPWRAEPEDRFYDSRTIFEYIDGAGEVYRAYNMQGCLSRRFVSPEGPALVLDIFDMGTSEDAFGVFTHDRDGEPLDIGQDALYRAGWLSFWKGPFFVSVFAERETPETRKAVEELGAKVSSVIKKKGRRPELLLQLPSEGLQTRSIRYLHDDTVLNHHFYLSDENILFLDPLTHAVLAKYGRSKKQAFLLLVTYPDPKKAMQAFESFMKHYLPDADDSGMAKLEDGKWCGSRRKDRRLVIVLEADTRQLSEGLLHETLEP